MLENILIETPSKIEPELVNEIRVSNRLLRVEGRIKEVIDYSECCLRDLIACEADHEVIKTVEMVIVKLESI